MDQDAELRLRVVRETLEGMLSPEMASSVMFAALEPYGQSPPRTSEAIDEFVRGALSQTMSQRVGSAEADDLVRRIEAVLGPQLKAMDEGRRPRRKRSSELKTAKYRQQKGPTRVVVAAAGSGLALRLRAALGAKVTTFSVPDAERLQTIATDFKPAIVLLDATDPVRETPSALVPILAELPDDVVTVVWGSHEASSVELVEKLEHAGVRATSLIRGEGVEPLLDLVRARRSQLG